jgi:hypothetical protein
VSFAIFGWAMRIFFDVDYTILGSDYSLRPRTHETFERLVDDGHEIHIWSGEGLRHGVLKNHELAHFVSGVYEKPIHDYVARLNELSVDVIPDFVIDDYSEIVTVFGGYYVTEYYRHREDDTEMDSIYECITEWADSGSSTSRRWRPRHDEFDDVLREARASWGT